jgi:dTDP-glucose pyrophosphorylase
MTRDKVVRVVVCAGGLGTRIADWARYIPKESYPVEGRPGPSLPLRANPVAPIRLSRRFYR